MRVEGSSPSTRIRSRFPIHPSLMAVDGVSIEVLDESGCIRRFHQVRRFFPATPPGRTAQNERLLARGELSFRRPDLPLRQSAAARAAETRTRQAPTAGALGDDSGTQ